MANSSNSSSGGIGFFSLLGIVFIALRLMGYIDWPWWVVFSPIWGIWTLKILIILVAVAIKVWLDSK